MSIRWKEAEQALLGGLNPPAATALHCLGRMRTDIIPIDVIVNTWNIDD